jgi:hypothetical protein
MGPSCTATTERRTAELAMGSIASAPALRGLRHGTVTAVVQDGVVVQAEHTEKFRLEKRERAR